MITAQPPRLCCSSPRSAISASAAGKDFVGALVEKRADVKTGRRIKDAFTALHGTLRDVRPFEGADFDDAYLLEATRDCEARGAPPTRRPRPLARPRPPARPLRSARPVS